MGLGGGINTAQKYSKEKMEEVISQPATYYNIHHWKFVEIKEDGKIVEVS